MQTVLLARNFRKSSAQLWGHESLASTPRGVNASTTGHKPLVPLPKKHHSEKDEAPDRHTAIGGLKKGSGSDLLSHAVFRGVPSALEGLTTVFEMGTGVTPPI
jgi:hypothetical protein